MRELVFQRSGNGPFGTANNDVSVEAGVLKSGVVEFALIVPGWRAALAGPLALRVKGEILNRLASECVYPLRDGGIELLDPGVAGASVLIRFSGEAIREINPSSLAEFDEVTLLRSNRPRSGEFKVRVPDGSPLDRHGPFTYGALLDQMARRYPKTAGHVAVAIAYAVADDIARSSS